MKKLTIYLLSIGWCLTYTSCLFAQSLSENWKFQTADRVLSSPVIDGSMLFIGSEDGNFYALNKQTGNELWRFRTRGRIQSTATVYGNIVFFESGNTFFALDKDTGKQRWQYDPGNALWGYKIDPYDDKRSRATVHKGNFYVGSSLGYVLVLDVETGALKQKIYAEYGFSVRSSPTIANDILYFGDWRGQIYAYSLDKDELLWKRRTYDTKPYETFGGIASALLVHEDRLYFGARNPELKAIDINTQENAWTYADSTGGWIIGDPVIDGETLYIGGSDNLKMFAFNQKDGTLKWAFNSKLNVYTKPIVTADWVIFTAGNAYKPDAPGKLFVLNKSDGKLLSSYEIPAACFSSPALDGDRLYFGAYDGKVYSLLLK
jgi:outer membrane protein assembly factor BamB